VRIAVNRNTVPFDERPPTVASGVRLGSPAVTMRGFDEDDMRETARIIAAALAESADVDAIAERTSALLERRPLYAGLGAFPTFGEEG
jgi:glycine hydroxymethyltransferase